MNIKTIKQLEKKRLKLYKKMIGLDKKMETCSLKELCTVQYEFAATYRKLIVIERMLKYRCPYITNELNYIKPINYKQLTKTR